MFTVLVLVIVGSSIWVGFDAQGRDFSDSNMARGPYAWAFGCLILWILFFPAYLAQRSRFPVKDGD
ncbi:MAG: hypothetical protein ABSB69_09995 [Solirubrobacteraceae bacterium]|jgi:hypothetical protein